MSGARPKVVIALLSLALVSLEIVWTRVFSGEFFYTFAFLALSLAVLGLGLGSLTVRLFPALARPRLLGVWLVLAAVLAVAGPPLVLHLDLDFSRLLASWAMAGRFLGLVSLLSVTYFLGGMALSILFREGHRDMPRLYMADLLGAAVGACAAIVLMNVFGTPRATFLVALPLLWAAFLAGGRGVRPLAALAALALVVLLPRAERWVAKPRQERLPVIARHWDAMALLKIQVYPGDEARNLNIDHAANTPVTRFDGNWASADPDLFGTLVPATALVKGMGGTCRFLSLGAGGGGDVLHALHDGAAEVHAVEVNGAINRLLTTGALADYSGRIYLDPRVRVVTEDARTYVRRFENRFDLIYSLSSNTFAALSSGAFALAENYLFTTEAFQDYLRALSPRGFLVMEHQFYVPRMVSEVLEALRRSGVSQPERHLAVYALPKARRQVILVGRQPLTPDLVRTAIRDTVLSDPGDFHEVFPNPHPKANPLVGRIVREGWAAVQPTAPVDLSPATDDRPFIAQMGLWRNVKGADLRQMDGMEIRGFPLSTVLILGILAVVALVVAPLNLLPCLRRGPRLRPAGWLFFAAIGFAFMAIEVVLIQKYTLFIGSSATTVAVILFTLLVGLGLGSRLAARVEDWVPFLGILAWLALEAFVFGRLTGAMAGLPPGGRVGISVLLIAPLGFFMGMPFPKGTGRVGDLVDWGFAINGAASVLGSCLIMLAAFRWGFRASLLLGGLGYLGAGLLLAGKAPWRSGARVTQNL